MDNIGLILAVLAGGLIAIAALYLFSFHTLQTIRIQKEYQSRSERLEAESAEKRNDSAARYQHEIAATQAEITKQMREQVNLAHIQAEREKNLGA